MPNRGGTASGSSYTLPTGASGIYVDPFSQLTNISPERVDMGVDYNASGVILAIGDAKVYAAAASGTGWDSPLNTQAFVGYTLTDGPFAGKSIYVAEDIQVLVGVGTVKAGQPIARFLQSPTGIETGWATGSGYSALAAQLNQFAPGSDPGAWPSASGASFNRFLISLGAPSGVISQAAHGQMPAGYP